MPTHAAAELNECLAAMAGTRNCNTPARPATTENLPKVSTGTPICAQIAMLTCFTYPPDLACAAHARYAVAEYRAYLIGDDGHFYDSFPLICADDAEAIEMAKKLVIDRDVELWQLDRKVGTFSLKQK